MKKCVLIINPKSGKNLERDYLYKFQKILDKAGYETVIYFTSHAKHATELIKNIDYADLVISLGGDGTFNEVVTGNLARKDRLLLAHIPVGSTNDVGAMFGYKKDPVANLKLALDGEVKGIDICTINDKPFVYVAGFGKFMNIPYETPRDLKSKYGYLAYIIEGVKALGGGTPLYEISYEVNGETKTGEYSFMLISSANRIAGINNFYKDVKLNDNKFEVILCSLTKKQEIARSLYYFATSNITSAPGFEFIKTDKLSLKFKSKLTAAWCVDGEKLDDLTDTYNIKIINNFNILMPKKNIKKLFIEE